MHYRRDIDGLRALAVSAVLVNHFFEGLFPNGYLGVDVFFVISGFVITGSFQGREDQPLLAFLAGFYARRIKRLVPALALVVLVSSFLICLVDPTPLDYLRTGLFALFGLANIYLYTQATDYFADAASLNPFTHMWSLGVEEQFYFAFPLLFWLGWHLVPGRAALWGFVGLVAASGLAWWLVTVSDPMLAFYMVFFRFWQIGLGVLMWFAQRRLQNRRGLRTAAFLVVVGVAYAPLTLDPRLATLVVGVATALLLLPGARLALLEARGPVWLGRVSYSLYLWHWPVAVMLSWTLGLSPVFGLLGIALSILLAHLSYLYLERPLRSAAWARSAPRELGLGLTAMFGVAVLLFVQGQFLQPHLFQGQRPQLAGVGVASLTAPYLSQSGAVWAGAPCVLASDDEVGKRIEPQTCTIGVPWAEAERRVLVVGNSFSTAFAAAFEVETTPPTAFLLTSSWGASPVPEISNDTPWQAANFYYWQDMVPDLISDLRPGDQLLLASDLAALSPLHSSDHTDLAALESGLRRLSTGLEESGIGLALIGPLPFAREARCEPDLALPQWYAPGGGPCHFLTRDESVTRLTPLNDLLKRLEAEGLVQMIAPFDLFCPGVNCGYMNSEGVMMFRDIWSHPSVEAAILMRSLITAWLGRLPAPNRR